MIIQNGATDNTIGGTATAARDVISGNNGDGVDILGSGTTGNLVEGDDIGTNAGGSSGDGNAGDGVSIFSGASNNTLQGDVISDNDADGVNISGSGTNDNLLVGDDIGTDATGSYSLPNYVGVLITNGASGNSVGAPGIGTAPSDVISGNRWDGIEITDGASSNLVEGDNIGVAAYLLHREGNLALADVARVGAAQRGQRRVHLRRRHQQHHRWDCRQRRKRHLREHLQRCLSRRLGDERQRCGRWTLSPGMASRVS